MAITSISGFLEKCFSNPLLKDDEKTVFYRGVNEIFKETPHIPSLYYPPNNFYEKEHLIFNETVSLFPDEMLRTENDRGETHPHETLQLPYENYGHGQKSPHRPFLLLLRR